MKVEAVIVVIKLAWFPVLLGMGLEYLACRVRRLGMTLPVVTAAGLLCFLSYDQRHAEEMLANGQMPEALGLVLGASILGGLLAGMILGGIFYHVKKKKA